MGSIADNLAAVKNRIAAACARAGRDPEAVRLLAVSKTYGPEAVREAAAAGQSMFGENRVQEAAAKIPECPGRLQWHLIGHLQGNKAAPAARLFDWVHSVDSAKLLEALDRHAGEAGRRLDVLVQVNVSGERSKSGLAPEAAPETLALGNRLRNVQVRGLMTIPPLAEDPEASRPFFRKLREWRDAWAAETGMDLPELSMGMSHDLEVAVGEGATFVRVGTGIFGARAKPEKTAEEDT
ncbi:MAG: YggS family pyridoxal phosphate-dependent enzyme [Kiritimatiellia bacterium]